MFPTIENPCCSPRERVDAPRLVHQGRTHIDTSSLPASLGPSVIARITKLEQQMNEIRPQINMISQRAPLNAQASVVERQEEQARHPLEQQQEALSVGSIELEDGDKMKGLKDAKHLMIEVKAWSTAMQDTKARLEQAISMLRVRLEQTLSQVGDLKLAVTTRCDEVEARVADMAELRAVPEAKMTARPLPIDTISDEYNTSEDRPAETPARPQTRKPTDATILDADLDQTSPPLEGIESKIKEKTVCMTSDEALATEPEDDGLAGIGSDQGGFINPHLGFGRGNDVIREPASAYTLKSAEERSPRNWQTKEAREKFAKIAPEFCFAESIWDAALFIGQPEVGSLGSVVIFILFIVNTIFQVSFCIICQKSLNENRFDDDTIEGLSDFRTFAAHDFRYQEGFGGASLARRMCARDVSHYTSHREIYASSQLDVLFTIDEYLGSDIGSGGLLMFRGQLMSLLALLCWIFNVAREAKNVWHFHAAMCTIDVGRFAQFEVHNHKIHIAVLSYHQYAMVITIILLRCGICAFLIYAGCTWLSLTTTIEDLLLNAVALEFVLAVDELIFAAAVPRQSKVLIVRLAPVKEKNWIFYYGVDLLSVSVLILSPTIALLFYMLVVTPLVDNMLAARLALCSQDLDFVHGFDTTGFMWFQDTSRRSVDLTLLSPLQQAQHRSLNQRMSGVVPEIGSTLPLGDVREVRTIVNMNWVDVTALNSGCNDVLKYMYNQSSKFSSNLAHLNWFRTVLQNSSLSSCKDLHSMGLCSNVELVGQVTRWLCSATCECYSPKSVSPPSGPEGGCPAACQASGLHTQLMEQLPCADTPRNELVQSSPFPHYVDYAWHVLKQLQLHTLAEQTKDVMLQLGCDSLRYSHEKVKYCTGTSISALRPLAPLCPIICGCKEVWLPDCPPQCWLDYHRHAHLNITTRGHDDHH